MKNLITIIIAVFFILNAHAQLGPNLTAGAGGLAFKQGQLDAQLILDIITTKKGEIKTELGKRLILKKVEGGSYAFYQYAEKSINLLFNDNNKQVVTKEFMENSAELLLVYGLAEYLFQDMANKGYNNLDAVEKKIVNLMYKNSDQNNKQKLAKYFFNEHDSIPHDTISSTKSYNQNKDSVGITLTGIDIPYTIDYEKYLLKPTLTKYLTNSEKKYLESKKKYVLNTKYYSGISMLVDLIYDVCINNQLVTSTGLFQSENNQNSRYNGLSKYKYFKDKKTGYTYKTLTDYKNKVDTIVTYLFSYYNIFKDVKNMYEDSGKVVLRKLISEAKLTSGDNLKAKIDKLKFNINTISRAANTVSLNHEIFEIEKKAIEQIQNIPKYSLNDPSEIEKEPTVWAKKYLDLSFTLQKEIIPILSTLNNARSGEYAEIIKEAIIISDILYNNSLYLLGKDTAKVYKSIKSLRNYLPLLDIINNLDRVESYDYMFKFLTGLGETYGDERTKAVVIAITSSIDKYTVISKQENNIKIDVEGIAVNLFDKFAKNQHSRISFFLTVGANHNTATGNNFKFVSSGSVQSDSLPYSSFISEKIGLKWNIIDWNRRRTFNHYGLIRKQKLDIRKAARINKDPLVNNLHLIVYGSGLLYQISALNSADKFTTPIIGSGLGITFFNGLDFNVSYAVPYSLSPNKGFISISFDIAIFEYLSALKNKRNQP